jgi:CRISPR-associated endonuclease/helicase Cas3
LLVEHRPPAITGSRKFCRSFRHAMTFTDFFHDATRSEKEPDGREPYPFQCRFAESDPLPNLMRAPTGSGKTATAILGWLWRWKSGKPNTPRRLVYCLPMRVLVEQSFAAALGWLHRLNVLDAPAGFNPEDPKQFAAYGPQLDEAAAEKVAVHQLMGGVEAEDWFLHAERPAVLIGTQDMLLSRALNRGYAASRFHWPIDFGLLNNDCLWVFDEPQLMGSGVSTSAQLAGLRTTLGSFGPCPSVWMSATLEPGWLDTIDFRGKFLGAPLELTDEDYNPKRPLHQRMTAAKVLRRLGVAASKDGKDVARAVWAEHRHQSGTQTLVVLNTVERAKAVYDELRKLRKRSETPALLLVHSRFRPAERERLNASLQEKDDAPVDRIIVATQVVEAGVDISSRTLVTELAPWASVVQRIGRCNRTGDDGTKENPARVFWIDLDEKLAPPYEPPALDFARKHLNRLEGEGVSPKALNDYKKANETPGEPFLPFEHKHVIRRRDVMELFDTSPDLSGNDLDVSRYVRGDDPETDVQVFWREWTGGTPNDRSKQGAPARDELCSAPINQVQDFLTKIGEQSPPLSGYLWDHLSNRWTALKLAQVRPGLVILLPASAGGYSWDGETGLGWHPTEKVTVRPIAPWRTEPEEGVASDPKSTLGIPLTIAAHTQNVCDELDGLLRTMSELLGDWTAHLTVAARWHDVGKAHSVFQDAVRENNHELAKSELWAKSGTRAPLRYRRRYFRHELASALVAIQRGLPFEVAYVVAAHHGRVRLAIRSLPDEEPPPDGDPLFALGVVDGDELPLVDLGGGTTSTATRIDLTPMRLGDESSWSRQALRLLAESGPFRLACLEALLRAADVRASKKEAGRD